MEEEEAKQQQAAEVPAEPAAAEVAGVPARTVAFRAAGGIALVAALVFVGWRMTVRPKLSPQALPGAGAPAESDIAATLAKGNYNIVLQVRAQDPGGGLAAIGTTLPRMLTLKFTDAEGRIYMQRFDRVGMWATEMAAGVYWIPPVQDELGEWKWKVSGDALVRDGDKGWRLTLAEGAVNPMIEILLY